MTSVFDGGVFKIIEGPKGDSLKNRDQNQQLIPRFLCSGSDRLIVADDICYDLRKLLGASMPVSSPHRVEA